MDPRGFSVEPSQTASPVTPGVPVGRMLAWADLAASRDTVDLVPAQRQHTAP